MKASVICLRAAILILVAGLLIGLGMGMVHNFQLAPAHAHLNLAGFVVLTLFGLTYETFPSAGRHGLARIQAWTSIVGAVVLGAGLVLLYGYGPQYEPVTVIGSLIFFVGALLFAWILFSGTRRSAMT